MDIFSFVSGMLILVMLGIGMLGGKESAKGCFMIIMGTVMLFAFLFFMAIILFSSY